MATYTSFRIRFTKQTRILRMWAYADLHKYRGRMDAQEIEQAVIMSLNDPWLMSMEFTVNAVHKNLYEIKQRYPGKFYAFADVDELCDSVCTLIADR